VRKEAVPYSEDVAVRLCERIADVGNLRKVCQEEGMPHPSTVYEWIGVVPGFNPMYLAAREQYADSEFDRLDDLMNEPAPKDDRGRIDVGWVQQQRLKVDTLKWKLSKLCPRRYSERLELVGAEGKPLVPELPLEQLQLEAARRMAFILQRADEIMKRKAPAPLLLVHEVAPPEAPPPPARREPPPPGHSGPEVYEPDDPFDGGAEEHGWQRRAGTARS
jgi:hypothetical protein